MTKLGIKEIHNFISTDLKIEIFKRYEAFEILSEADLQSHVWQLLFEYFRQHEEKNGIFMVHNKPYHKELRNHPDLVVYRRNKPYIIIELKEWRSSLKQISADTDLQRLLEAKKHFYETHKYKIKRGYFMYVSWKPFKILDKGTKGKGARFLFDVSLISDYSIFTKEWKNEFKKRSKYIKKS
jgi:hypothetical protein